MTYICSGRSRGISWGRGGGGNGGRNDRERTRLEGGCSPFISGRVGGDFQHREGELERASAFTNLGALWWPEDDLIKKLNLVEKLII